MTPPGELDYAPPPPWHRRRSTMRALIWLAGAAIAASTLFWGPAAWDRIALIYWQNKCLQHTPLAQDTVYAGPAATPDGQPAIHIPPAWDAFYARLSPPGLRSAGTAFLHERHTHDGQRRLVAVDFISARTAGAWHALDFQVRLIEPGTLWRPPREVGGFPHRGISRQRIDGGEQPPALTIHPGRPDPNDSTRFTIDYTLDGRRHTVEGWLVSDRSLILRDPL